MADGTAGPGAAPSNTPSAPQNQSNTPTDASPTAPPPARDYNAEISKLLQESGFKLKSGDREHAVGFEELVRKAKSGYGIERVIGEARTAQQEAASLKEWKSAMEADDEGAAVQAFDSLSPKAQANALSWLQKKAAAFERESALPPEAQQERRARQEAEARLKAFEAQERARVQQAKQQEAVKEVRQVQQTVLGIVQKTLVGIGASESVAPALVPLAARHLRVALEVAAASGGNISTADIHAEVIANVQSDLREQMGMLSGAIKDDSALLDWLGPKVVARLARESIRRRTNGGKSAPGAVPAARPAARQSEQEKPMTAVDARRANRDMFR